MRLVVATHNGHKLAEFRRMVGQVLAGSSVDAAGNPSPRETGVTFEENALIKARAAAAATEHPAFADDSGLSVDVLGGSPGIFSARWGGHQAGDRFNRTLLLEQLADVPDGHRSARFVCAIALVIPARADAEAVAALGGDGSQREFVVRGEWLGSVAHTERGDGGFGYDPVFIPLGLDRTAGELTPDEKDSVSHRARAFRALVPILRREFSRG